LFEFHQPLPLLRYLKPPAVIKKQHYRQPNYPVLLLKFCPAKNDSAGKNINQQAI